MKSEKMKQKTVKKERREENIQHGKDLIERELKRINLSHSQLFRPEWIEMLCKKYTFSSIDDIYAAVGYGGLTVNKVLGRLKEEYRKGYKIGSKVIRHSMVVVAN